MPLDNPTFEPTPDDPDPFAEYNTSASNILFPVATRRVGWETRAGFAVAPTYKAIVRVAPNNVEPKLLNIVGADYKLVHNKELFTRVEDAMKKQMLPEHLHNVQVTDKVSGFGRICFRQYVFPNIKCKVGRISRSYLPDVAFRVIVQNGYGGSALRIYSGAIDFYCSNGMVRGDHMANYRRHTKGLEITGISELIEQALLAFAGNGEMWARWANTELPWHKARIFLDALNITPKLRDNISLQYQREIDMRGHTLWTLYSALTYYASHGDGVFKLRASDADTEAQTMLQREINVSRWTQTKVWKELENA